MKTKLRPIKSSKLAKRPLTQGYDDKKEFYISKNSKKL